jgi:hypothetical protein
MKLLNFIVLLVISTYSISQSPLLQSNSKTVTRAGNSLLADSLNFKKVNLQLIDTIRLPLDSSFKIFERLGVNNKQLDRVGEIQKNLAELQKQSKDATKAEKAKYLKQIRVLEKKLAEQNSEYKRYLKEKQQGIDSVQFENLKLKDGGIHLQLQISARDLKVLSDTLEKQYQKIKTMHDEWIKQRWREDGKTLNRSDDSLLFLAYSKITLSLDEANRGYNTLLPVVKQATDSLNGLQRQEEKISSILSLGYVSALLTPLQQMVTALDRSMNSYNESIKFLNKQLDATGNLVNDKQNGYLEGEQTIKNIYSKYKVDEKQESGDMKALASFTQPVADEGKLVPQISILGFRQKNLPNQSFAYNLKLFVSSSETKSVINSEYRFFIPEASTYGFMADFSFGFLPIPNNDNKQTIKTLGLNGGAYYLGKSLVRIKDSTTYNIGLLQFKLGMQYILIPHVLNIYANLNPFFVANGNESFSKVYNGYTKRLNMFTDFGVECYLELTKKQNDFFLDFDLGFISKGGDVSSIMITQDAVIPRIKVGLVKSFNF